MRLAINRSTPFYELLESQAQQAALAAKTFDSFITDFRLMPEALRKMEQIEHDADALTHDFVKKINSHYFTPMDREDLHGLTDRLDDITDAIESAAARMGVYRLPSPRHDLQGLVRMLVTITHEVQSMVGMLRNGLDQMELHATIAGIHALESDSDKAFRQALDDLFSDEQLDTRLLIKWQDVYERIEKAINLNEKLASYIQGLMVKYS